MSQSIPTAQHARPARPDASGWAEFGALGLIWGSSYLWIKVGLDEGLPPVGLVSLRLVFAVAFLALALWVTGGRVPMTRAWAGRAILLGVVNVALPWLLITWGTQWVASSLAAILNALMPLFTIVIAAFVLHDEPITVNRLGGLLLGFAGAVVLTSPHLSGVAAGGDGSPVLAGEVALAAAGLCYAIGAVAARRMVTGRGLVQDPRTGPRPPTSIEIAFAQVIVALVVVTGVDFVAERSSAVVVTLPETAPAWVAVAWLGLLGSGVAYILAFRLVRRWDATRYSLVTYVIPVVAMILGTTILHERLDAAELVGSAMILFGVVLTNSRVGGRRLAGRAIPPADTGTIIEEG